MGGVMLVIRVANLTPLYTLLAFLILVLPLPAQGLDYVKAHYTKTEHQVPMRDGVRLFTAVYTPKDTSQKYPILLMRTQSGIRPYGADQYHVDLGPSALFGKEGYIFVYQDIRGRWMSEGTFVDLRPINPAKGPKDVDESSDTFDTIDWLIKNVPNHNGKVGHQGMSYRGFLVASGLIDAHPALKAASPQAPIMDQFAGDDWHHNGAFFLSHAFFYAPRHGSRAGLHKEPHFANFTYPTPDGYDFFLRLGPLSNIDGNYFKGQNRFWNDLLAHSTYDEYWKTRNLRPHLKNIKPAVLTVGGWFDAENLFGVLEAHRCFEADRANNVLVMGPWIHGGWNGGTGAALGPVSFGSNTAAYYREKVELPFFNFHLKGKGEWRPPKALAFETGTNRWREYPSWPPPETKPLTLYFHPGGKLGHQPPGQSSQAFDEYVSDPAKPVPFSDKIGTIMMPEYMCADQRFAARRPDVLVYESEVLAKEVMLAGPIEVHLHVSTTGTDSDWIVKLIDVYPDDYADPSPNPLTPTLSPAAGERGRGEGGVKMGGYQQLVRGEVLRGRFRNSLEKPERFEPGKPTTVTFKLLDVCHTFRPGHKMMVQVHSSWFPLVDRNPQKFVDIARAREADFQKATQRVYRSKELPSRLVAQMGR